MKRHPINSTPVLREVKDGTGVQLYAPFVKRCYLESPDKDTFVTICVNSVREAARMLKCEWFLQARIEDSLIHIDLDIPNDVKYRLLKLVRT